ncbi:MAG: hypothetical protein JSW58_08675 [Candidatus Latescibacterota bacterium]|nr:MAG: hypothetical protein JSW58_08675 [Candidatus Latescibacterota bacterium]
MRLTSLLLVVCLGLSPGCGVTQPTYVDVGPKTIESIAERLGTDVETLMTTQRDQLALELSEILGAKVERLHDTVEGQGSEVSGVASSVEGLRAVVAEIQPATEAALEAFGAKIGEGDPTKPDSWLRGAIAAAGILAAGALGFRGRSKRKKNGGAPAGGSNSPQPSGEGGKHA